MEKNQELVFKEKKNNKKRIICDKISKGSLSNGHKIKLIKTIARTSIHVDN